MQNPIIRLKTQHGISRVEMARRINCCYAQLKQLEQGYRVKLTNVSAEKIAKCFDEDPRKLQEEYLTWRQAVGE